MAKTFTIDEIKEKMERYLDASQERLRAKLRAAWKRQKSISKAYDQVKV